MEPTNNVYDASGRALTALTTAPKGVANLPRRPRNRMRRPLPPHAGQAKCRIISTRRTAMMNTGVQRCGEGPQKAVEVKVRISPKTKSSLVLLAGACGIGLAVWLWAPTAAAQEAGARIASAEVQAPTRRAKKAVRSAPKSNITSKATGQYFIEFRSRYAQSYGHTFVVFGRLNARGEIGEIKPDMVAGLHPAGAGSELWVVGHAVPVPAETGWSDGDLEEQYVSNRFRVLLSEAQHAKLVAHIRHKQANSPIWHAALYNCNLWTGEIAQYLGLQTGFHWLPPAAYIERIKVLNGGEEQAVETASLLPEQNASGAASLPSAQYSASNGSMPSTSWSDPAR